MNAALERLPFLTEIFGGRRLRAIGGELAELFDLLTAQLASGEVRLETGKTHQIRIHLAESGHPLVGERVYIRDFTAAGHEPLESRRLLLHAATLGFVHPTTGAPLRFESPLPDDFTRADVSISLDISGTPTAIEAAKIAVNPPV